MSPQPGEQPPTTPSPDSASLPRFAIIGAGSRGNAYAQATVTSGLGTIEAVVEPIAFKRRLLASQFIGPDSEAHVHQHFSDHHQFIAYEWQRRENHRAGRPGVDGVFVCVRDELHADVVTALAPLQLHILCEKPLATTLDDCLRIQRTLGQYRPMVFAIGHVLRYSPHNMLLRHLVREKRVIGEVLSIEHTEPVGWWHFSHSYVRGNWRKESYTAPSLLTKSCHDIDWLLWMLCSPMPGSTDEPHLPATVSSTGSLKQFRRSRKPTEAADATNCLSCPIQTSCIYSAPRIYHDRHLANGHLRWPVDIVRPEIETIYRRDGPEQARKSLLSALSEDYDAARTPVRDIESRPWFGRCVWESDNDVCDDQFVTMEWHDDHDAPAHAHGRSAKTASFHMIAQTLAQCARRGCIYGSTGEIQYDSQRITVHRFDTDHTDVWHPEVPANSHHGGGDQGLTQQFLKAVVAVRSGEQSVAEAQEHHLGVTLEECVRSHAAVFMAEHARRSQTVVRWTDWWKDHVEDKSKPSSVL